MQLGFSLSVLLASLLLANPGVEALPARRNAGTVTLPLKRLHGQRSDLHPQVVSTQRDESWVSSNVFTALATTHQSRAQTSGQDDGPCRANR